MVVERAFGCGEDILPKEQRRRGEGHQHEEVYLPAGLRQPLKFFVQAHHTPVEYRKKRNTKGILIVVLLL